MQPRLLRRLKKKRNIFKVTLSFRNDLEFILNILISQTDPCQQVQGLGVCLLSREAFYHNSLYSLFFLKDFMSLLLITVSNI